MGGTQSKATVESVTSIISNVIVKDVMNCATYINQDQSVNVYGSGNVVSGITMVQGATIDMTCYRKSNNDIDIQNKIINALTQAANATGSGFPTLDAGTKAETVSRMTQDIRNNITIDMLQNCAATVNQSQSINVVGNRNIVANQAMTQTAAQMKHCTSDQIAKTALGATINNSVAQQATSVTQSPFKFLTDIIGSITDTIQHGFDSIVFVVGGIILMIIVMAGGLGSGGNDDDDDDYDSQQDQYAEGETAPINTRPTRPPNSIRATVTRTINKIADKTPDKTADKTADKSADKPKEEEESED